MKLPRKGDTNRTLSDIWGLTERRVIELRKDAPLDDLAAMKEWNVANPDALSTKLKTRLADLLAISERGGGTGIDPDWEEFQRTTAGDVDDDPKKAMAAVARARAFAAFKFDKAAKENNRDDLKFFADLVAKLDSTLHDQQLRAKKLGIDAGDLVPRSEVERIARAWVFWAMRAVDADLAELCPKLTGLAQVNDVRGVLEPALLSNRFLKPFARAARIASPSAVPDWLVAILRDACDDYIENGAEEFKDVGLR